MERGISQVLPGDLLDAAVQSRREQQSLRPGRDRFEDPGDRGQEPEVGHVISLVDDERVHAGQRARPPPDVIFEAAGCRHHDVHAPLQGLRLRPHGGAAVDRDDR